jgi:hypothetical protein
MSTKTKSLIVRFVKGFISGAIASAIAFLQMGFQVGSQAEFTNFAYGLLIATISGALLSAEKALSWKE